MLAGLGYLGFGYSAINLIFHFSRAEGGDSASPSRLSRFLLEQPAGAYLVGAVALAIIGFGIGQVVIAWRENFTRGLELPRNRGWLLPICKIGISARGIAFVIVGWFMLRSRSTASSKRRTGAESAPASASLVTFSLRPPTIQSTLEAACFAKRFRSP